ncbi:MAG: SGNH/GDSL hydrolase family protein [Rhodospirillales bacterium]|nr:SGNH/GDSL hydrolase family protein [Rhodospirillales bacterium]
MTGQGKPARNWARAIVATLGILAASAIVAEIAARTVFGLETLQYRRPYQPVFVSGDYHYLMPNERLPYVPGGPVALGYHEGRFGLYYDAATPPPHSSTTLADFLFTHRHARYDAAEIDRITCAEPDATLVHVLGGSVAQGFSADEAPDTWHARLEGLLRDRLRRQDVYVFNGAMGGFVSVQERLAYHLAVAPRRASLVLFVNGYNDVTIPANSGVRPGDPFQLGLRYSQLFNDGFIWWFARHSAIAHTILQNEFNDHVTAFRRRLNEDDAVFRKQAEAITDIYIENMNEVLAACEARGQPCLVAVQPARAVTAARLGSGSDDILSQKRMTEIYALLLDKVAASPHRAKYVDLTRIFDKGEKLQLFADSVHPNYAGQQVMANALLAPALAALRSARTAPPLPDRCRKKG